MVYFDTAYLVKCYINENGSEKVRALAGEAERIACCEYGRVELHAALHRNFREGRIDRDYFDVVLDQLDRDDADGIWSWLPLTPNLIKRVAETFRTASPTLFLRSGDAVHLCCAKENGFEEIYSNDVHLLKATLHFGLEGRNVV